MYLPLFSMRVECYFLFSTGGILLIVIAPPSSLALLLLPETVGCCSDILDGFLEASFLPLSSFQPSGGLGSLPAKISLICFWPRVSYLINALAIICSFSVFF